MRRVWAQSLALTMLSATGASAAGARRLDPAGTPAIQTIQIDIRGPIAHVTVTRSLRCSGPVVRSTPTTRAPAAIPAPSPAADATDTVLDLALPARAQLLGVAIGADGSRFQPMKVTTPSAASDAYLPSLRTRGLTAAKVPFEDDARYRLRTTCLGSNNSNSILLQYDFSALLEIDHGVASLAFPAAAELSPPPTQVDVRATAPFALAEISVAGADHSVRVGLVATARELISTRNPWFVLLRPARTGGDDSRLVALTASAVPGTGPPLLAYAIGTVPAPITSTPGAIASRSLPDRVLFVIDRSRSVGPGGLEGEREVARRVLEALPPATRFDAIFFDRTAKRLFSLPRTATREAMTALEDEMVTARLANGTDLAGALRAAGNLLRQEAAAFGPRCLLVVLTDGAVGPTSFTPATFSAVDLMVAALSVRPNDDPPVSADDRRVLRRLAAAGSSGGVERTIRRGEVGEAVPAILETLRAGGDVFAVAWGEGSAPELADVVEAGGGVSGIVDGGKAHDGPPRLLRYRGARHPVALRPSVVTARWLQVLKEPHHAEGRLLIRGNFSALVEAVVRPPVAAAVDDAPRGYMERSVVRDALSLAFTPRARACYLNRTAKTAADRDLAGRVRLVLHLIRGEVAGAFVASSTLAHPGIESCLREAAYAIEVPRAYRNDDDVAAVLNLVFRPRTPDRRPSGIENPELSRELDVIIEAALQQIDGPENSATDAATDR